jgi:hypothetical protein
MCNVTGGRDPAPTEKVGSPVFRTERTDVRRHENLAGTGERAPGGGGRGKAGGPGARGPRMARGEQGVTGLGPGRAGGWPRRRAAVRIARRLALRVRHRPVVANPEPDRVDRQLVTAGTVGRS